MVKPYIKFFHKVCVLLFFSMNIVSAVAATSAGMKIQRWYTSQGVAVYFVNRPEIPMVDIAVVFSAGAARDAKKWGLASLTSAMMDEGTTSKSSIDVAREFDQVGAQMSAAADRDMTVLSLRSLTRAQYFDPAFHLFLDIMKHPSFPDTSFFRVKNQTLDAIQQSLQDPSTVAQNTFFKNLYQDQPYGHPVIGTQETITAIQLSDLKKFYQQYYVKENALLVMVGALNEKEAHDISEKIASALPTGKVAQPLPVSQQTQTGKNIFISMPVTQNSILMGENGIRRDDANYFNVLVANHVLGGLPMTSLLFNDVRNKKGLAYFVYSGFMPLAAKGPFLIMLQTRAEKSYEAIDIVRQTVKNYLEAGPTKRELEDAKLNLVGGFPLKIASNHAMLENVINIAFYQLPLTFLETYTKHIDQVTIASATAAFNTVVQLSRFNTVVVGPRQGHDK